MPLALAACSLFTGSRHKWIGTLFAVSCFAAFGQASSSTAQEFILRGTASHKEGDLNRAATSLEMALAELKGSASDPELISVTYTELAFVRLEQGQLTDAERLLRKALAICGTRGEEGVPARIVASGNLALALIEEAKYIEADALTSPALVEAAAVFGRKSKQYATLLAIRGNIAMDRDQLPRAIKLLERAIAIMEGKQPDREELGHAYQNLAAAAIQAGKTKLALASLRRAQDTWLSFLPENHPALIDEQNTLICIYLRTRQYQKAYAATISLLPRAEKILGPDHPRFAVILSNAGMIFEHEMREEQAAEAFHRAYQINLHALGPMHPNTAYALLGYGKAIAKDGQPAQGASLQRQATALLNTLH